MREPRYDETYFDGLEWLDSLASSKEDDGMQEKEYLGDGVYARIDTIGDLVLTTEDGTRITNEIYLELCVWLRLKQYMEQRVDEEVQS